MANRDSEILILRECLYTLQGMNGATLYFDKEQEFQISNLDSEFALSNPSQSLLGQGAEEALRSCCKAGWYYGRIQEYITKAKDANSSSSSVAKALATALQDYLLDHYHSLLADWESKLDATNNDDGIISLRQLMIRLREPTHQLRTLAMVVDGLKGIKRGSEILTALVQHSWHGDSRHVKLVQGLIQKASQPWFDALYFWTTQGMLIMEDDEFFVVKSEKREIPGKANADNAVLNWKDTFVVYKERVPTGIMNQTLVQPSLTVGKGINFIRQCLRDSGWKLSLLEDKHLDTLSSEGGTFDDEELKKELFGYRYHPPKDIVVSRCNSTRQTSKLAKTLEVAEEQINSYIVEALRERHNLMDHLHGLKQFLLLGQGDFISALLESLYPELEWEGGTGLHAYSLMGFVDSALKSTNASQLPSWVLERLSVKMLSKEQQDSMLQFRFSLQAEGDDNAWDTFALDYSVPAPLTAIVHDSAMDHYHQVFSFLWALKRVEFLLNLTWRQSTDLNHAIITFAQYHAINMASHQPYAQAITLLRHISMARQSMMHFIINLKSYLFFEVLEGAWKTLSSRIEQGESLDELIQAHDEYLNEIIQMSLLFNEDGDASLGLQLNCLLSLVLKFCTIQRDIFSSATKKVEEATKLLKQAEQRTKQGEWGFTSPTENDETEEFFGLSDPIQLTEVIDLSDEFYLATQRLLKRLHEITHGISGARQSSMRSPTDDNDSDTMFSSAARHDQLNVDSLQFLTFQLDFSGFYKLDDE
eukprot:CAMPEP_0194215716 /NCGR_PEP_ID=MMETSP0156-20130528/17725_1 /TAXON_ID=33649 /ORGANISM="Thalassionema nitzschioides, Strain L26-B" /LENGTH=758 /DNA_ID=CAMNT_0038944313 /DNA_START=45 /DNA_END=2318 /DNA_ORIENTATION=+